MTLLWRHCNGTIEIIPHVWGSTLIAVEHVYEFTFLFVTFSYFGSNLADATI